MTATVTSNTDIARKVLVYGASGVQGQAIVRALLDEGFAVRACVRDRSKAAALGRSVEVALADLDDRDALLCANRGVDAVVLTIPLSFARPTLLRWTQHAATAARAAGVRLVVLNAGARIPDVPSEMPACELRRECESVLRSIGPACISLRPALFMENLATPWIWAAMERHHVVPYPIAAQARVSWLAVADLGAYVTAALRRPDLAGRALDIGGPDALDGRELARALSARPEHPLQYHVVTPGQVQEELAPTLGAEIARGVALNYAWMAKRAETPWLAGTSPELVRALKRPPATVHSWARARNLLA